MLFYIMKFSHERMEQKMDKSFHHKNNPQRDDLARRPEKEYPISLKVFENVQSYTLDDKGTFKKQQVFEWDQFQLADPEFVQWINHHPGDPKVLAVMAEMKRCPPVKPFIDTHRSKVRDIPLCSIEEYRKQKKLGEGSVAFLKEMKHTYGNNLLRFLHLTL